MTLSGYRLRIYCRDQHTLPMGVTVTPVDDEDTRAFILESLQRAGYTPRANQGAIHVDGAGVGLGDHSINLTVDVVSLEETKLVRLSSHLQTRADFETASLAANRGNGACTVTKFDVIESPTEDHEHRFTVRASLILYADHLSEEEFTRMTWLYLKETDTIDNELETVLASPTSERG